MLISEFINGREAKQNMLYSMGQKMLHPFGQAPIENSNSDIYSTGNYNFPKALTLASNGGCSEIQGALEKASLWRLLVGKNFMKVKNNPEIWFYTDGVDVKGCVRSEGEQRIMNITSPPSQANITELPNEYKRFDSHLIFSQILANKAEQDLREERFKSAIQFAQIAGWSTLSYWDFHRIKGDALTKLEQPKKAIEEYTSAIDKHKGAWNCYIKRGDLYVLDRSTIRRAYEDYKRVATHCLRNGKLKAEATRKYKEIEKRIK